MMMMKTPTTSHHLHAFINPRFRLKVNIIITNPLSSSLLESFKFITTSCNPPFSLHSNSYLLNRHSSPSSSQKFRNLYDALKLFDEMSQTTPLPSLIKFNQLLSSVTKMNHFSSTLHLFNRMCAVGLPVDDYSINSAIKCCCQLYRTNDGFALLGSCFRRAVVPTVVTFSTLLDGLVRAERFFKKLIKRKLCEPNVVMYSTMIKGLCKFGGNDIAIGLLRLMDERGCKPNVVTYNTLFDSLCKDKLIDDAFKLFKEMVFDKGILPDVITYNSIIYGLCLVGRWDEVYKMLKEMEDVRISPDLRTYSILVDALCKEGKVGEAEAVIDIMVERGVVPNIVIYSSLIDGYCLRGEMTKARTLFYSFASKGFIPDLVTYNNLLSGYCKSLNIEEAESVIDMMVERGVVPDIVTYNSLIAGYCLRVEMTKARTLFDSLMSSGLIPDVFTYNIMINGYCNNLNIEEAMHMFLEMKRKGLKPNTVTYNTMLQGFFLVGRCGDAHKLFEEMRAQGIGFDETTLLAILTYAASLQVVNVSEQIHGLSLRTGFQSDPFVINSLIDSYAKCGSVIEARKVFDESVIIVLAAFTSLISAYAQSGQGEEGIKLYLKMQDLELKPDSFICSSLLYTSASLSAYELGKQIHVHTLKFGLLSDTFTSNSLVNMYAKCGSIDDATRAFSEVPEKDIVSWSVMIGGFAQNGHGKEALSLFDDVLKDGIVPDNVTLLNVLCACNHAGLVTQAKQYFESMEDVFGIEPSLEHYTCMIDILARDGKLHEAIDLVNSMPFEADGSVWGAILGAARIHKNVEIGQTAARKLMLLDPVRSGICLANIYASAGSWENAADVRRLMKDSKVKKVPGMSWLE